MTPDAAEHAAAVVGREPLPVTSIPVIETARLILRPFRAADFEPLAHLNRDPAFMRFFGARAMSPGESWRKLAMFIGHWQLRGFGFWAVEEKAGGRFIGRIGCHEPEGWPGFEVGWGLDPAFWGRGLATEGGRAALVYAYAMLGVSEVISVIDPDNAASIRVAEKLGARYERRMDLDGQPVLIYRHRDPRARG